ncbi:alpha-L-fucosidase [Micromonospora zingiberis]|uniref:alpha-L-fucosidase n=1 Tax=Micromonospora zingiberis TaxID=2053011 RepID=A0A4R0GS53_9ACTN|nr:alpha-L-fucosidase [Micromonospora zingiberis]TCC00471.1 alpha-L-fucosidase [Micromonospora zingiberis]
MSRPPLTRRSLLAALGAGGAAAAVGIGAGGIARPLPAHAAIPGPSSYAETWASVGQHPAAAEWFQDAKFGIYFHWGAFSVPAYANEWYPRNMYNAGSNENNHHRNTYGDPSVWPYHNFINGANDRSGRFVQFAPRLRSAGGNFDPNEWAQLFVDAGARFAGPVAEHHDGFSMWNSQVNEWNSVARGPRLDLLRLHTDAIRARGLKVMVAMHHAFNFTGFYGWAPQQSDPSLRKLYGQLGTAAQEQLWFDKLREIIDQAQPDIIWQDFDLRRISDAQRLRFLAYYYNRAVAWDKEVVATYKDGLELGGAVYDYERGGPAELREPYWLTDDSISSSSWSYTVGLGYYTLNQMLHSLIDRVSKNGNMVLNIAPMADGTIPTGQQTLLRSIGDYLRRFGESIYSTRAWTAFGEGPTRMGGGYFVAPVAGTPQDIRFTRSKDSRVLYATILGWPGSTVNITTLASNRINLSSLAGVQLLGSTAGSYINLPTRTQDATGLRITMPSASAPFSAPAYVVKLTFNGPIPTLGGGPTVSPPVSVYQHTGYENGVNLAVGSYTAAQLQAAGVGLRTISSVRVTAGHQLVGYANDNFSGTSWTFTSDNADLRNTGNNDAIASLRVTFNPATYQRITNVTNGLVLDSGGNVASGAQLKQWSWDSSTNLQWQLVDLGTGYHRIVNRTNGMVVDGFGATSSGAAAQQAPWNGSNNQQWQITDQGNRRYRIANRATGLVLDGGGQVASGSIVKQWSWDGSTNLLWTITAV